MWVFPFRFSPETASKRGLSTAEINAVEAIHRAVEFNPHVPKVRVFPLLLDHFLSSSEKAMLRYLVIGAFLASSFLKVVVAPLTELLNTLVFISRVFCGQN